MVLSEQALINLRSMFIELDARKIGNFDSQIGLIGMILEEPFTPPKTK